MGEMLCSLTTAVRAPIFVGYLFCAKIGDKQKYIYTVISLCCFDKRGDMGEERKKYGWIETVIWVIYNRTVA